MKQQYVPYKLGRRSDAFHKGTPAVYNGKIFGIATASVYDIEKYASDEGPIVKQDKFVPIIGKCVIIQGHGFYDYVRTSLIEDFYIHEDYENSKDKIVLKPENAHLLDNIEFNVGDVLLITMNSLYLLKVA